MRREAMRQPVAGRTEPWTVQRDHRHWGAAATAGAAACVGVAATRPAALPLQLAAGGLAFAGAL
jgi:hypothetical protein